MTDLELKRALQDLSNVRSDAEPVVTLYLDTRWSDEKHRERVRVFVQDEERWALDRHAAHPQLDALRRTLARVARAAAERSQQPDGESQGLAVFACEALGLWRVMGVPRPFERSGSCCCAGRRIGSPTHDGQPASHGQSRACSNAARASSSSRAQPCSEKPSPPG